MNVKTIFCGAAAAFALAAPVISAAAENARLPYHMLYSVEKAQTDWNATHTNLVVVMVMESTRPAVPPSGISVFIDSKSGRIPVTVHSAGDFSIPMRDDLLAEDPWIVTDQPRGTMKLDWRVGVIPGRLDKTVRYARLMRPVRESEDIQQQMRRFFPGSPRLAVTGLKMTFPLSDAKPFAVIHTRGGDRTLTANEHGEIILPLSSDLMDENPAISLSTIPQTVAIVSHKMQD